MGAFITPEWKARKVRNPLQDIESLRVRKMPDVVCCMQKTIFLSGFACPLMYVDILNQDLPMTNAVMEMQ